MEKRKKRGKLTDISVFLFIIIFIAGAVFSCANINADRYVKDGGASTSTLAGGVTYPTDTNSKLGQYPNGTSYVFTDKNKVDDFRARATEFDMSFLKVDTTATRGSQLNPYVISTVEDWDNFAKQMDTDTTRGSGKYFLLANDIDFDGRTFHPVRFFNGTFYGMGNKLLNISVSGTAGWVYWNGSAYAQIPTSGAGSICPYGYGVFCQTTGATITDFLVDNYDFKDMPATVAYGSRAISSTGGVVGLALEDNYILNCHTYGQIKSTLTYGNFFPGGGILGSHDVTTGTMNFYRCSTQVDFDIRVSQCPMLGGIIGEAHNGGTVRLYDCASDVTATVAGSYMHLGGVAGLMEIATYYVENTLTNISITSSAPQAGGALGSVWVDTTKLNYTNCYNAGEIGAAGAEKLSLVSITGQKTLNTSTTTAKNVNVVKSTANYAPTYYSYGDRLNVAGLGRTEHASINALIDAAEANVKLNSADSMSSQIWDADRVKSVKTYWDKSYAGSETMLDYSPVRNYLVAIVSYRNLISGGDGEEPVGIEDGKEYVTGAALEPAPSATYLAGKANHVFRGWTYDKTGKVEPFTELPSGMFGEVTLYAVWDLPEPYVNGNIATSLALAKDDSGNEIDEITYDSVTSITLIGEVKHTAPSSGSMLNPKIEYQWLQDGEPKAGAAQSSLSVKSVPDSGEYTYKYTIRDGNEPLWYHTAEQGTSKTILINKGVLSLKSFKVSEDTVPYFGKKIKEVEFTIKVQNSKGLEVALKDSEWTSQLGEVKQGENARVITVFPVDDVNYNTKYDITGAKFNSVALTLVFDLFELHETLAVEVEYDNTYGNLEIIHKFEQAYLAALEGDNPAYDDVRNSGYAPYFSLTKDGVYAPITPDASGKPIFNERFEHLCDTETVYVSFVEAEYTITFNPDNGGATNVFKQTRKYGQFISKPSDPTNGSLLFVGWYADFDLGKGDGSVESRAWRFNSETLADGTVIPQDRVVGNTALTAKWLDANMVESITVAPKSGRTFIARNEIVDGDLIVKATYSGTMDGKTVTKEVTLNWGDYKIIYPSADKKLHVTDGGYKITVSHSFGTSVNVQSDPVALDVQPIDKTAEVSVINFGDTNGEIYFTYEAGVAKNLRTIPVTEYPLNELTNIKYAYYKSDGSTEIAASNVIERGTYYVEISYEFDTPDYGAESKQLRLVIAIMADIRIEWSDTSLTFNGTEQFPKATAYYVDNGDMARVTFDYTGDIDAKNARGGYTVTAVVVAGNFNIVGGATCTFEIVKAVLDAPAYVAGAIIYDGTQKNLADGSNLSGYDPALMVIKEGVQTNAGTYHAYIDLLDKANCAWSDGTTASKDIEWKIEPKQLIVNWDKRKFVYDGMSAFAPKVVGLNTLASGESVNYTTDIIYKLYDADGNVIDASEVGELGSYKIVASFNGSATWTENYVLDATSRECGFVIVTSLNVKVIAINWGETQFLYDGEVHYPSFTVLDENGNDITTDVRDLLKFSDGYRKERELGTYKVKVTLKDSAADEYVILGGTGTCTYKIVDENGYAPDEEETANRTNGGDDNKDKPGASFDLGKVTEFLKQYWQVIVSGVSILLIIIFTAKGISYAGKRKKVKKTIDKKYSSSYYAALWLEGNGLFSLPYKTWTIIAFALAGTAVLSLIFMILEKKRYNNAEEELDDAKEEFGRNQRDYEYRRKEDSDMRRDDEYRRQNEEMRMMFMNMMGAAGAGAQPQYASMGGGTNITVDAENIKGIITETVAALLPGMQAMLPQQAGSNDEMVKMLADNMAEERRRSDEERRKSDERMAEERRKSDETIQRLLDKSQKSDERMAQLMEKILEKETAPVVAPVIDNSNNEAMAQMLKNQEELIKQLLDKEPATVTVDKSNDEAYERMLKSQEELIHKLLDKEPAPAEDEEEEPQTKRGRRKSKKGQVEEVADDNSEQMEQLARNQELLMQQLQELANKEPQVVEVEKIIDNTDNETLDQLVRQINELAAHANKEPKVVEKIVEVPVEKVVEKIVEKKVPVEKVVEKIVKVPAEKKGATATTSTRTPRLNIDEAYAKLSKEQKKYFDKLREYALSKEKSKEKKSTYYILLGQSSVNPLVKLTIKKDTTVALFKMEDEYFKDLRRNADGAKVKVKESELIVADQESFNMAKQMIDLRVDQIDRYQEYLKEQREYNKK